MTKKVVVVSAGTYHLPFDRLSIWTEEWFRRQTGVRLVMQHGPSRPVHGAENFDILPYGEFLALCERADAVVLQGGAGGVMDMRALGIVPIVVPRVPGDGEVVDDHQLVFTAEVESLGIIRRALSQEELIDQLDRLLHEEAPTAAAEIATPGAAVTKELLERPIKRLPLIRVPGRLGRSLAALVAEKFRR